MTKAKPITEDEVGYIKSVLDYNPNTGVFTWKKRIANCVKVGEEAGANVDNYVRIQIKGKSIYAHRLAFLFMGQPSPEYVDHINGVRSDNRWVNLRACSKSENNCNVRNRADNKSGIKGVDWHKMTSKWQARIQKSDKRVTLGFFDCIAHAACVRAVAEDKYHKEFTYKGGR